MSLFCRFIAVLSLLLMLASTAEAQKKIKYKDLFPLLDAKRYEEAEPFLKSFLLQDPDFSNANYQMGLILAAKAYKSDLLKETDQRVSYADSAVIFFNKTNQLITEKDLKKNGDYYQDFNRRDLRTGKFGISLSDVQYELDNKVKEIQSLKEVSLSLKTDFDAFGVAYDSCLLLYGQLKEAYTDYYVLKLAGAAGLPDALAQLKTQYVRFDTHYKQYQFTLPKLQKPSYNQQAKIIAVAGMPAEALNQPDYYAAELIIYDFKRWAEQLTTEVSTLPLFGSIAAFSETLHALGDRIGVDTTLSSDQVPVRIKEELRQEIAAADQQSSLEPYFNIRCRWLLYRYDTSSVYHPLHKDSLRYNDHIRVGQELLRQLESIQAMVQGMAQYKPGFEYQKYQYYLDQEYGGQAEYEQMLSDWSTRVGEEVRVQREAIARWEQLANWAYSETDTLYLNIAEGDSLNLSWRTLQFQVRDSLLVASGVNSDTSEAFVAKISEARQIEWLTRLPLTELQGADSLQSDLQLLSSVPADADPVIVCFRPSGADSEGIQVLVTKVSLAGELQWQKKISLAEMPSRIVHDTEQGEIDLYIMAEEQPAARLDEKGNLKE